MPALDTKIDDLYRRPLNEFIAGRAALAKTLTGTEAKRVKSLQKPTVVPWTVNQLYWHTRPVYERLVSTGEKLRTAQLEALKGRSADVRRPTEAHRKALADAVAEALRLASGAGVHPAPDELAKMLEAVSLARELPEPPGRLTKPLRPAGFEALAGVPLKAPPPAQPAPRPARGPHVIAKTTAITAAREADERRKEADERRKKEAEERRRRKAVERAEKALDQAKAEEGRARAAWDRAREAVAAAELTLSTLQRG